MKKGHRFGPGACGSASIKLAPASCTVGGSECWKSANQKWVNLVKKTALLGSHSTIFRKSNADRKRNDLNQHEWQGTTIEIGHGDRRRHAAPFMKNSANRMAVSGTKSAG